MDMPKKHIADYITFISDGNIIFCKSKDELLDNYGIVKCSKEQFKEIDRKDFINYKKSKYEYELLIANRVGFKRKYDIQIIDKPSIEDIMLIYIKGDK